MNNWGDKGEAVAQTVSQYGRSANPESAARARRLARDAVQLCDAIAQVASSVADVMSSVATEREHRAANYRQMAQVPGPRSTYYLERAHCLEVQASHTRAFAEHEAGVALWLGRRAADADPPTAAELAALRDRRRAPQVRLADQLAGNVSDVTLRRTVKNSLVTRQDLP